MFKTLRISFLLRNTYRVNSILYAVRLIPFLKNIIPSDVYRIRGFKFFANIVSVIWEFVSAFAGKLLYFLFMLIGMSDLYFQYNGNPQLPVVLHFLVFLSAAGAFVNTYMFNPEKDKYYAIMILKMDAGKYTLVNYFYSVVKIIIGYGLFSFIFIYPMGLFAWQTVLVPFFVAGIKMISDTFSLLYYEKKGMVKNENKLSLVSWLFVAVFFISAYGLPLFDIVLPEMVSVVIMVIVVVVVAFLCVPKILAFKDYRAMCRELLNDALVMQMDKTSQIKLRREKSYSNIDSARNIKSEKKGIDFLNELFIKRHKKILWMSSVKIAIISFAVFICFIILFFIKPEIRTIVNDMFMTYLPYTIFVMYLVNRGSGFTNALFLNCDHSLFSYSFFKQPDFILRLFRRRLCELIKINLLPATVIGAGLVCLLYFSGGTDNFVNYIIPFVSVICLSIFFSVHYLNMYYLLQPYNAETEITSGTYKIIMALTYLISYGMIQIRMSTFVFGIMTMVFCVLYCIIACLLVYRFAPVTFKIRK